MNVGDERGVASSAAHAASLAPGEIEALCRAAAAAIEGSAAWPHQDGPQGIRLATGRLPQSDLRGYRSVTPLAAPPERVARLLADDALDAFPRWSREFRDGEVLARAAAAWLLRVRYATPWPLADREYHYRLARRTEPDGAFLIALGSCPADATPSRGSTRAHLDPTGYRIRTTAEGGSLLEHALFTDLGGALPRWLQSTLLVAPLLAAHRRDAMALQALYQP